MLLPSKCNLARDKEVVALAVGAATAASKRSFATPKAVAADCNQAVVPSMPKGKGAGNKLAPRAYKALAVSAKKGCAKSKRVPGPMAT